MRRRHLLHEVQEPREGRLRPDAARGVGVWRRQTTLRRQRRRVLLDDAEILWDDDGGRRLYGGDDYESPAQHVYTCRPHDDIGGMRSPAGFWLCIIAVILSVPLGWASVKFPAQAIRSIRGRRAEARVALRLVPVRLASGRPTRDHRLRALGVALRADREVLEGRVRRKDVRRRGRRPQRRGVFPRRGVGGPARAQIRTAGRRGRWFQGRAGGEGGAALRGFQGSQQHQNAAPVAYAAAVVPQQQTISITIPPGTGPGSVLNCPLPDGRTVQVTVPPGGAPGASDSGGGAAVNISTSPTTTLSPPSAASTRPSQAPIFGCASTTWSRAGRPATAPQGAARRGVRQVRRIAAAELQYAPPTHPVSRRAPPFHHRMLYFALILPCARLMPSAPTFL